MLWLMDEAWNVTAIVDGFGRLVWNQRYDGAGQVEVRLPGRYFTPALGARYLYRPDSGEAALIEEVARIEEGIVQVKGRSAEAVLALRVLNEAVGAGGTVAQAVVGQIGACFSNERGLQAFAVSEDIPEEGGVFHGGEAGEELLSFCVSRLNPLGMYIKVTPEDSGLLCRVQKGQDRSADVVFTDSFENLRGLVYRRQMGATVAYVAGSDEDGLPMVLTVDCSNGRTRKECFVDGSSVKRVYRNAQGERVTRGAAEYEALLTQLGEEALGGGEVTLRASVNERVDRLHEEYEIGDLVTVEDTVSGVSAVCRVMGAEEIFEDGGRVLNVALGPV